MLHLLLPHQIVPEEAQTKKSRMIFRFISTCWDLFDLLVGNSLFKFCRSDFYCSFSWMWWAVQQLPSCVFAQYYKWYLNHTVSTCGSSWGNIIYWDQFGRDNHTVKYLISVQDSRDSDQWQISLSEVSSKSDQQHPRYCVWQTEGWRDGRVPTLSPTAGGNSATNG